jgi:hypothetical protein
VVWRDADLFGCRFARPLSQATLSAALLRAAPLLPPAAAAARPGENAALARLRRQWNFEGDAASSSKSILPLGRRMWIIAGLAVAGWAIPAVVIAGIFR